MTDGLVEDELECLVVELLCLFWDASDYLLDVRLVFVLLHDGKLVACALADFEECVTCHLHDTRELLFHELEKFLDDGFQESPVVAQECWILADDVHDA